jgi:hypothetical protein
MPSRAPAPGDPTAPASAALPIPSSSVTLPVEPSSASAMVSSVASQVRRPAPDSLPKSSSSSSGKKARLHGPDLARAARAADDDVDMRLPDERKAEVDVPCSPLASAERHPPDTASALVSSSPLSASSSSLPEARVGATVPVWASLHKLRAAGLDPRVLTDLVGDVTVDTRAAGAEARVLV